jgi:PEP-CTERM motif
MIQQLKVLTAAAVLSFAAGGALANPVSSEIGPNLVTNGGFETGDFSNWTQSGNLGFTGVTSQYANSGSYSASFGPVGSLGFISQNIETVIGVAYNIHLWLRSDGGTPSALSVDFGGVNVFFQENPPNQEWFTEIVIDPIATSTSTTLTIGLRNDPGWHQIDDIAVFATSSRELDVAAVPEPASLALLSLGLVGLGFSRRKQAA